MHPCVASSLRGLGWIAGFLCASAWSHTARAYEDQLGLGAAVGYGHVVSDRSLPAHGVLVDLNANLGLDDIWTVRGRVSFAHHPSSEPLSLAFASTDLVYLVDVFELVPYFGAGVDVMLSRYAGASSADLGLHPVLGVDWLISREHALGLEARPVFLVTALEAEPVYFSVTVALTWLLPL